MEGDLIVDADICAGRRIAEFWQLQWTERQRSEFRLEKVNAV